jgi:hypothetical protein
MIAARVGPARAPRIRNGSTGRAGLRSRGNTDTQEKRKAMVKNAISGYFDTVLFILSSPFRRIFRPS